jgi:hypothetical protein
MGVARRLQRLVAVFRAFFDESGNDRSRNKALVMGGFVGHVDEWLKIADAWDDCLRQHPRIEYFKHYECQNLSGQFWQFNREQADRKKLDLAAVIGGFDLQGLCAIVPHVLGDIDKAARKYVEQAARVYDWGFITAIKLAIQWMEPQPDSERVDFIFDEHSALESNIENFNSNKKDPFLKDYLRHAGRCTPGKDEEVAALQMADLLAGEFSAEGQGIRSDALRIIGTKNQVGYLRCDPPVQHIPLLDLLSFGAQLRREVGEYLKLDRQNLLTQDEAYERLTNLFAREAYINLQRKRLIEFLENDPAYREFRQKYIAATGIDPMVLEQDQ